MRFEGKRVVITGGASGIGRGTVDAFIAEGAQVMMGDLNEEVGNAMAADAGFDNRLAFQKTDVCEDDDIKSLIDNAAAHMGGVDILFNNAGAGGAIETIDEIDADGWDQTQHLLLRSCAMGIRHVVPHMKEAGGGAIINTSSINADEAGWGPIAYAVAKAGVRHLSKISAAQLAQFNIRVNSISPGFIMTNIFAETYKDDPEEAQRVDAAIKMVSPMAQPVSRSGQPADIAQAVLYLASEDHGGFVNGIDLKVDGGITVGHRHSWDSEVPGLLDLVDPANAAG